MVSISFWLFFISHKNKLNNFNDIQYWSRVESPRPFIFMDMSMKYCITDYEMNLENHYSEVPVLSFVEYIEVSHSIMR